MTVSWLGELVHWGGGKASVINLLNRIWESTAFIWFLVFTLLTGTYYLAIKYIYVIVGGL